MTLVKIARHGESFWCEVLEPFGKDAMKCRVDNQTSGPHGLRFNDRVIVKKSEVRETVTS